MREVVVGSESGRTRHELSRGYARVLPDVYAIGRRDLSLRDRTVAAWLWSKRRGVIAGAAASALHGAQWVDATEPIELIAGSARRHPGLLVRNETLAPDEVTKVAGIPVTTLTRTAFDLARHLPRDDAVARRDALKYAAPYSVKDVMRYAQRYPGARGLKSLRTVLPLVDGGAASPREPGFGCCSSMTGCLDPPRRSPSSRAEAGWYACSTWAGRTSWSGRSTTATNTAPIARSTQRTFGSSASSRTWAGA
jgi:hypothetical protein